MSESAPGRPVRVLGRDGGVDSPTASDDHVAHLGRYRARDGSAGAPVGLDVDGPHAVLIVGKRGYGKSHTMGVLAEDLARTAGVSPTIADPMGVFRSLSNGNHAIPATDVAPTVSAATLGPRAWCDLLSLDPAGPAGSLVWRAAAESETLAELQTRVADADAAPAARRAAVNHLRLAATWDVVDAGEPAAIDTAGCTTIDLSGLDGPAMNAVAAGVASRCYDGRVAGAFDRLPWVLVDEAHAFFDGVAEPALRRLLTRGRHPGVSLVAATQRPSALPPVAISQADVVVVHRLTSRADREALADARPSYLSTSVADRMPTGVGEALVIDDATETVHTIQVREREAPHDGASPRASAVNGGSA